MLYSMKSRKPLTAVELGTAAPRGGAAEETELHRLLPPLPGATLRDGRRRSKCRVWIAGISIRHDLCGHPHPPSLGWFPPLPQCAGLSGEKSGGDQGKEFACQFRLGRARPGHPRLGAVDTKAWVRGSSPRKTTLTRFHGVLHKSSLQENFPRTGLRSAGEGAEQSEAGEGLVRPAAASRA